MRLPFLLVGCVCGLGEEVAKTGEDHVFDTLGADSGSARPAFADGVAVLETLTQAAAVALVAVSYTHLYLNLQLACQLDRA